MGKQRDQRPAEEKAGAEPTAERFTASKMIIAKILDGPVPMHFITPISWNRSIIAMTMVFMMVNMTVMKMTAMKKRTTLSASSIMLTMFGAISFHERTSQSSC